ncbi:MAG: ParB/RepB/Spo0J family partition protein [Gammaproteobacteria bacterium]|nr:ParB/RepB/Spo0J family partition protein [Gammaproteobacteria bacterium]
MKTANICKSSVGNVRKDLGDLSELTASIKENGILEPIAVRPTPGDNYEIVFGFRRFAVAQVLKLDVVPVVVWQKLSDEKVIEFQLVENLNREDIHPMDEAIGFFKLREDHKKLVEDIVKATGKVKAYIYASMKLVELSALAQEAFRKGKFDVSVAVPLARISTEEGQAKAVKVVQGLPAREAFAEIDKINEHIELDAKWEKVKAKALKDNTSVLTQAAAAKTLNDGFVRHDSDFVNLDAQDFNHPKMLKYRDIVKKNMPPVILAQCPDSHKIFKLASKKDFAKSVKAIYGEKGYLPDKQTLSPEVAKRNEKVLAFRKFKTQAMPLVIEKAITGSTVNFLRALLLLCIDVAPGLFNRILLKPYDRKDAEFRHSIGTMNEKQLRDELFVLLASEVNESKFANVCNLLKVSDASISKIKQQVSDEAKAKTQRAKEIEKKKLAKAKADKAKPKGEEKAKPAPKYSKGRRASKKS